MTDGEWWRKSGPWSDRSAAGSAAGGAEGGAEGGADADSVYDSAAYGSTAPAAGGMESVPLDPPRLEPAEVDPEAVPPPQVYGSGAPGWDLVMLNFSEPQSASPPKPAAKPIPDQRAGEAAEPAAQPEPARTAAASAKARRQQKKAQAKAKAKAGGGAKAKAAASGKGARRPSPLILLSCALLVGGAATGFFPAMLAGWGLGYLSRQLTDLMRKFAILGIPLITMSATTLYGMQHAKQTAQAGGGGAGIQPGSPLGQFTLLSAPGVLRLSAVLSALVLLVLSLRRRPPQQG
ncbi:hypothetical protein [Kitasatospora sp. NPDC097643]|uniref:hypothetical protein n=1 Tax=Kitasatospora sp. NPDC097643 TaxID=3157230 RepID=UPI003331AA59